jgi:hypothetical protein
LFNNSKSSSIEKEACVNSGFKVADHLGEVNEVVNIKEQAKISFLKCEWLDIINQIVK